jgi:hypothetical protein
MLEVLIVEHAVDRWEWRVCDPAGLAILNGFTRTRRAARYHGDRGLFTLLARGWVVET